MFSMRGGKIGGLSAVLSWMDALIFCGGIGENASPIRQSISEGLKYLGVHIDLVLNAQKAPSIGSGRTQVMVIPTDEERVIDRAVRRQMHHRGRIGASRAVSVSSPRMRHDFCRQVSK